MHDRAHYAHHTLGQLCRLEQNLTQASTERNDGLEAWLLLLLNRRLSVLLAHGGVAPSSDTRTRPLVLCKQRRLVVAQCVSTEAFLSGGSRERLESLAHGEVGGSTTSVAAETPAIAPELKCRCQSLGAYCLACAAAQVDPRAAAARRPAEHRAKVAHGLQENLDQGERGEGRQSKPNYSRV
eukprot:scaffold9353_cov31-Tisochrysis_lutea.AAC.8